MNIKMLERDLKELNKVLVSDFMKEIDEVLDNYAFCQENGINLKRNWETVKGMCIEKTMGVNFTEYRFCVKDNLYVGKNGFTMPKTGIHPFNYEQMLINTKEAMFIFLNNFRSFKQALYADIEAAI